MGDFSKTLFDQIRDLARRVRNLELANFTYGSQPSTPPEDLTITNLAGNVTYYVEPISLLPRAVVQWSWSKPSVDSEDTDPVVDFMVSITRSTDSTTGEFSSVGDVTSLVTSGLPVNTNVTIRIYAVTRKGVKGPVASATRSIALSSTQPPQPATPGVSAAVRGVRVSNNGQTPTGDPMPIDLKYYEIHALNGGTATFTPTDATLWSVFGKNEVAYVIANEQYEPIAIRLVAVNTSGLKSAPSTGVVATPTKITDSDADITLPTGSGYSDTGNLLVDGSFEMANIRALRGTGNAAFSYANNEGGSEHGSWYVKATNTVETSTVRDFPLNADGISTHQLAEFMVQFGYKYYVSAQMRNVGADGTAVLGVRFRKSDNTFVHVTKEVPASTMETGDWDQVQMIAIAPDKAVSAYVYVQLKADNTAGEWHFDSVEIRQVLTTFLIEDSAITRAKIGYAAIGTAQIEEVDASVIKSGFISNDRLESNSIETRHIKIGAVTKNELASTIGQDIDIATNPALNDMASKTVLDGVSANVGSIAADVEALNNVIEIDSNGVTISQQGSPFRVNLNNSSLDFYEGDSRVAYINGQRMYIRSAEIAEQLKIGVHIVERYDDNNTFIRWVG